MTIMSRDELIYAAAERLYTIYQERSAGQYTFSGLLFSLMAEIDRANAGLDSLLFDLPARNYYEQ